MSCEDDIERKSSHMSANGSGMWVLVVGPSGAGKDTIMRLASDMLQDCPRIVFAKRVVTRPPNAFEDHETASEEDFLAMQKAAQFVMSWQAHGLSYGIHRRFQDDVNTGCIVICNVSRTIIRDAKRRLGKVAVVLITAPDDVLGERIAARGRDQAAGSRTSRDLNQAAAEQADIIINNVGPPHDGAARFHDYLKGLNGVAKP
ncbi:MAG: phosphonate metabolism protein/1,5-bisphosphokinase (PRPP-forming) PhnN [Pseudomonadota bacterium]